MSIYGFLLLLTFKCILLVAQYDKVDHYVNLIENEVSKALVYKSPTDLSAFNVSSNKIKVFGYYDYVIVGAGSTGAVLASRLSEVETNSVLLLEAGGPGTEFTDIPAMYSYVQNSEFNWNYTTIPQTTSCLGMNNRQCKCSRGKGLGGSSLINSLMYVRGNKEDYDRWCSQGNPGWCFKDVLPYFIKSENSKINGDCDYHGIGGNLNVEYHTPDSPKLSAFIEANVELGRKVVDYNGKDQLGVAKAQFNTINGSRDSTAKAFLTPALGRKNLKVLTHSLAIKVLIKPKSKIAYGILFSTKGRLFKAIARKDVIVSAGSIASPQLLMLSGIGPRYHLRKLGIPVIAPLAVGQNLQDHATYFPLNVKTNIQEPTPTLISNVKEFLKGYGPFTLPLNVEGVGFFQIKPTNVSSLPDIEIVLVSSSRKFKHLQSLYGYDDGILDSTGSKVDSSNVLKLYVSLLHPQSLGQITLQSKNPFVFPLIDLHILSDPGGKDIETLYQGIKLALQIINTDGFKKLNASLVDDSHPACRGYKYLSREYWYCQLRYLTFQVYHPVGTCKMGPDPKQGAVVDAKLRVHGIKNLRVADASVIPDAISAHPNAPCIMIAEKLSDVIKEENDNNLK